MSPYFQRPLELGAHLSLNSVSKYINGHSDVIMGVVTWNDDSLGQRIRFLQNSLGGVPSPFDCYLANRGLKTLAIRMRKHEANAMKIAATLEKHPKVCYLFVEECWQYIFCNFLGQKSALSRAEVTSTT